MNRGTTLVADHKHLPPLNLLTPNLRLDLLDSVKVLPSAFPILCHRQAFTKSLTRCHAAAPYSLDL